MAINNDRNLLEQQILSNSGLKGKELENLKARLAKLSEQQLQAELSKSLSGNNKEEWYTGIALEHNESVVMRNNHDKTTYTDDNGNEISELKDGDEVLERTIKSTDDKGNVFETTVTFSGGRPLTQTKSKNGNTTETTTYKYNDDAEVPFVTVETKKSDQSKVMTNVLEVDENGNFNNEDFIDRQTTSMDGTTTHIFTENNCVIEQQVKPNGKKIDTIYKGDSIEDYDNKKLHRVYQRTELKGEVHEVAYDGNGNTRTVVQNGESPSAIAKKFGVKESSLRRLNPARGKNAITQVGADIVVPGEYNADARVMTRRKSKLGAMQDFANDEVQRTAQRLYSSTMQEVTLDKDYKDAYSYARALLAADGVKNPSNQQVNNKANEILVANGNIKFKKGTKVQIASKTADSKFVAELSNNGFKPTRENAIFYNRFNALNPTQQQNVLSVIKYCKSQNITDPNKIKARILETFPEINLFDSGKTVTQNDFTTPVYQRKNVALETFLTETLKLDLKSDVGRTVYERLASLPQEELNKINAQNFSDMSKANFNDIANHLETSGVNIRTQMENQIEQANIAHREERLGIPQQKFTSEMLANIYDRAADMMEEYYHNHGVLDAGTYLEGMKNLMDWITPDNLFGIDMRSTLHVASDCRKAAQRFRQMHTDNPETFKREYAKLKKEGLVTADYDKQNVQEFMNLIQSGDVDINSDKFKNACKKAFGFKGVENTEKYIQTGQMAGNIGDIAVMLYTLGAASELKMMGKATQGVYGALERGAGRFMSKTAAQKTAKIGTSMAMGGTTLGGFTLGKETLNNLSNPMRDATNWETWKETGIASAESFGFGAFGGLLNETVVAPIVKAIEKPATKATQAVSKALTEQGELTGKQIMQTVSESGSLKLDGLFKMNSQELANFARTATAKGVGFGVEVTGFTAYEAGLDVIKDLIDPKTGRLPENITVESLTEYLGEKFGEQFSNLGTIKGISQLLMMSKGGKVAQRAMMNEILSKSDALKDIKFKKAEINGHEVYEVTYPNGNRAVVSSPEQAIATCQMAMQMEFLAKSLTEGELKSEITRPQGIERKTRTTDVQTNFLGQRKIIGDGDNNAAYKEIEYLVGTKESPLEENHSTSQFNGVQNFNVQNYRKKLSEMKAVQDESMELKPRFTAEEINSLVELKQKYGDIVDRYINQTISANGMEFPIYRTAKEVAKMIELSKAHKMLTSSLSKLTVKTVDDTGQEIEVPRFNSDNIETIIKAWEKNSKLTNELLKNVSTHDGDRYLPLQHPDEILDIVEANEINPTLTRELMQIKDEHYIGEDGTIHFNLTEQEKALVEKGEHPENLQKISLQKFYGDQIKLLVILNKSNPKITELFKSEHSGNAVQDFSDAYLENRSFIDKLLEEKEQLGVDGLDNSYYVTELAKYRKNSPELADKLLHKTFTLGGETHKMPVAHIIDILKVSNKDNIDVINKALEGYTYRRGLHEQQESRFFADDIVKIAKATTKENKDIVLKALEKRAVYNEIDGYEYNDQHKLSAKTKEVETFAYGADDIVNLARMSEINRAEVLKELGGNKKPVIENWNNDSLKYTDTKEIFIRTLEKQFGEASDFIALAKESLNNQYFGNDNFKAILDLIDGGDIDVQAQNVHRYICQNIKEANYDRETGYPLHEIPQELRDMVLRNVADAKYDRVTGENIDEKIAEFLQNQRAEQQNIPLPERLVQYKSKIENKLLEDKINKIVEQYKDDPEFQSDLKDLYSSTTEPKDLYKLIHTYDDIKFDRATGEKISHSEKLRLFKAQIIQDNKLAPSEGVTRFSKDDQVTLKQYNKKDVEQLANEKIRDILGNEDYKYDGKQIAELLKIKATNEALYDLLNTLQCVDFNGDPYFPHSHENLKLINSIAMHDKGGAEIAKFVSSEVITQGKVRQQKFNKYELEKINELLSTYPPIVLYRGLSKYNLEIQDLNKYCEARKNYDEKLVDKLLLLGFNIDHTNAILQGYDKTFVNNMVDGINKAKQSNNLKSTKLKVSEDPKATLIGDDIHIRVEDENGNIYKVDKTTGEVTSLNIGNKTINLKTGETTEVKIVTDEKLNPISKDGTSVYEDVPEYIEVYRSADGKEISHEKLRESKVPGNYEIYSYRKGADGKITKDLIGLAEYDGNGGVHIEKNVESLNGTKTQTVYADDVQGNRFSYYRVTDANGKVLYENTEKFKKISDDHYQTFTNGQGYDIQYFEDRVVITKLDKNNKPTKEKIEYTIKDFTEEEYKKFYDELNSKAEEAGEAINNVTQDIIRTKKDLGKVDIDAILKDQNIQEHTIDRSLMPTLKDLSGEDYFNLFGQTKILVGELSESGNAYSINGGIAVSKEQYGKLSTLLHEAGHEHTARLNLVEDKELNEIYEREKAAFVNTFPDEAIETLEYFLANNEVFVQNKNNDLIRVKGMKGLDETTAESKLITKYKPQWELTQARTAMLQQYFPETIACIARKNSTNISTPEVKTDKVKTVRKMVDSTDVQANVLSEKTISEIFEKSNLSDEQTDAILKNMGMTDKDIRRLHWNKTPNLNKIVAVLKHLSDNSQMVKIESGDLSDCIRFVERTDINLVAQLLTNNKGLSGEDVKNILGNIVYNRFNTSSFPGLLNSTDRKLRLQVAKDLLDTDNAKLLTEILPRINSENKDTILSYYLDKSENDNSYTDIMNKLKSLYPDNIHIEEFVLTFAKTPEQMNVLDKLVNKDNIAKVRDILEYMESSPEIAKQISDFVSKDIDLLLPDKMSILEDTINGKSLDFAESEFIRIRELRNSADFKTMQDKLLNMFHIHEQLKIEKFTEQNPNSLPLINKYLDLIAKNYTEYDHVYFSEFMEIIKDHPELENMFENMIQMKDYDQTPRFDVFFIMKNVLESASKSEEHRNLIENVLYAKEENNKNYKYEYYTVSTLATLIKDYNSTEVQIVKDLMSKTYTSKLMEEQRSFNISEVSDMMKYTQTKDSRETLFNYIDSQQYTPKEIVELMELHDRYPNQTELIKNLLNIEFENLPENYTERKRFNISDVKNLVDTYEKYPQDNGFIDKLINRYDSFSDGNVRTPRYNDRQIAVIVRLANESPETRVIVNEYIEKNYTFHNGLTRSLSADELESFVKYALKSPKHKSIVDKVIERTENIDCFESVMDEYDKNPEYIESLINMTKNDENGNRVPRFDIEGIDYLKDLKHKELLQFEELDVNDIGHYVNFNSAREKLLNDEKYRTVVFTIGTKRWYDELNGDNMSSYFRYNEVGYCVDFLYKLCTDKNLGYTKDEISLLAGCMNGAFEEFIQRICTDTSLNLSHQKIIDTLSALNLNDRMEASFKERYYNLVYKICSEKELANIKDALPQITLAVDRSNIDQLENLILNYKTLEITPNQISTLISPTNEISIKQLQRLNRVMGRHKASQLNETDLKIACDFTDLYGKQNINEIPIERKKELLHSLVSSNTGLFEISDNMSKDFPLIPKNQEEYCSLLPSIVRSLGIETNELTPEQRITMFNSSMGELSKSLAELSDTDFSKMTITQEYPKDKFILDVLDKVKSLPRTERQKVYDYFGFELHHNKENSTGFSITGYPVNLNNGKKLAQIEDPRTKAVVEDLRPNVVRFSENNKIKCNNPKVEKFLNEVIEALPELRTAIGKKQHGSQAFDVMQHSLKVMQKITQDPKFATLNESDQKIMLLASLMHDITKSEGRVDKTHANEGSFDTFFIAQKFNLTKDEEIKLHTLIKHHEWLEYVNTAKSEDQLKRRLQSVAYDLHQGNLFDMAEIFTHADLRAVRTDDSFHDTTEGKSRIGFDGTVRSFGQSADIYAQRIRSYAQELQKSQPLLPQTKFPRASRINEAITQVNSDGSTNIKGVYKDKDGLVIIKFNEVEDWEAIGFPKGSISHGIEIHRGEKGAENLSEYVNTGNIKFFVHGLDYSNQLAKFDAFSLVDSDALLSVSYAERPESKYRFFRPQGVLLDVNSKYIHGGGDTDRGSGCGKDIAEFKNNYIFGGYREKDRLYVSELIKGATGMNDEQYIKFVEENKDKSLNEIEPVEIREKLIKAFATINSHQRKGNRRYNEMYISNPNEVMGVFAYNMDYNENIENPIEFLNRDVLGKYDYGFSTADSRTVKDRTSFLRQYALERDLPFIIFGD